MGGGTQSRLKSSLTPPQSRSEDPGKEQRPPEMEPDLPVAVPVSPAGADDRGLPSEAGALATADLGKS